MRPIRTICSLFILAALCGALVYAQQPTATGKPAKQVLTEDDLKASRPAEEPSAEAPAQPSEEQAAAQAVADDSKVDPKDLDRDEKGIQASIASIEERLKGEMTQSERDSLTDVLQGYRQRLAEVKRQKAENAAKPKPDAAEGQNGEAASESKPAEGQEQPAQEQQKQEEPPK